MSVYTVYEPPLRAGEASADPERFAFVRDGFSFWAFLFGPLWMLRYRMWLVLLGYVVLVAALAAAHRALDAAPGARVALPLLIALLIGWEAPTLRRFALERRRWRNVGIVVGDDRELAERRFFDAWIKPPAQAPSTGTSSAPPPGATAGPTELRSTGVIGLFPEPGAGP